MPPVLKIDTVLGPARHLDSDDELLLTSLDGTEGVSTPYTYDIVLMRKVEKDEVPIDKILGTSARIGLLSTDDEDKDKDKDKSGRPKYIHRLGCFTQFQRTGLSKKQRRRVYKARLIPAVMYWG